MREQLCIQASFFNATFAHIQTLRDELERFVRHKEKYRDFMPDIDIEVVGPGAMDKLQLRVDIRHKSDWAIESIRPARRSKFICALALAVRKIPIRTPGAEPPADEPADDKPGPDPPDDSNNKGRDSSSTQEAKRLLASAADAPMTEAKATRFGPGPSGLVPASRLRSLPATCLRRPS